MKTPPKPLGAWFLTALLAAETVFLASRMNPNAPFFVSALLGAAAIQVGTCRSRFELPATLLPAVGLALLRFGLHLGPLYENPAGFGLFLGLASLFVMGVRVAHSRPDQVRENVAAFGAALALPLFMIATTRVLPETGRAHPLTLDRILYAFDSSLGLQTSFVLGRLLTRWTWLRALAKLAYEQAPLAATFLYVRTMGPGKRRKPNLFILFGVAGLAGYLLYALVPAAGPCHLFPSQFPNSAPPLAGLALLPVALPADIPRNAMPSLHMAWAVLMFWSTRQSSAWLRIGYGLLLFLTVLCTLGSGEHYLIDLVVALPFALAVQAAFSVPVRELPRSWPFLAGSVGTLAWLGFLRFGASLWLGSIGLDWSLASVTVGGAVILERQAYRKFRASVEMRQAAKRQQFEAASAVL